MERIENRYCLHSINDWLLAQDQGLVKKIKREQDSLENILELAGCDCLPMSVVCARHNGNNYMLADEQWDKLFRFLKNEIVIYDGEHRSIHFRDLPSFKQQRILEAQVCSVWVSVDNNTK